jgi:hypothetical protein
MSSLSKGIFCFLLCSIGFAALPRHIRAQSVPPAYTSCSAEYSNCSFSGTRLVAFGANNSYTYQFATNGIACSVSAFGTDPANGTQKTCSLSATYGSASPGGYSVCSAEYNNCSVIGTQLIGFGISGVFVYKELSGTVACTESTFGIDPSYGNTKSCIISSVTINQKLGKPGRVLIGLGNGNSISQINSQSIKPDIIDTYLPGVGSSSWISYSSPSGAYVTNTANAANGIGAIPMYTLYQMAQNGDGNITDIGQSSFMDSYWSQVRLMFQKLGSYNKAALVNLEPDFWGYVEAKANNGDPTQLYAVVSDQSECSSLPNTAAGIAGCMIAMRNKYAPLALVGYPASFFGETAPQLATFMQKIGAQHADFIVAQTSDRDAGCEEVSNPPSECSGRGSGPFYWDENNQYTPNFTQSINNWTTYKNDLGNNLKVIWWQTPMGVKSSTAGGSNQHYRDDHVDYMLHNAYLYGNMGSFGIVFSAGADSQTTINTDGGQFANDFKTYLGHGGNGVQ